MCKFGSSYSREGTPEELAVSSKQDSLFQQMASQAQQIFGADNVIFNQLMTAFAPIVQAGPNQYGFSVPQDINLRSGAITDVGTAVRNAQQATAEGAAAMSAGGGYMGRGAGGGEVAIPSGARAALNARINTAGGIETARELGQITQAGYQQGRQNWASAVQGELSAPGVFSSATQAGQAANLAGQAAFKSEDALKVKQGGWGGALGGILGSAASLIPGVGPIVGAGVKAAMGGGSTDLSGANIYNPFGGGGGGGGSSDNMMYDDQGNII